jgi:hypothetical protein
LPTRAFPGGGLLADVELLDVPDELDPHLRAFAIVVPGSRGEVIAYDAEGEELERQAWVAGGAPSGGGDLVPLLDINDAIVGYVSREAEGTFVWTQPGSAATGQDIRSAAVTPLVDVNPNVADWWESRPGPAATDDAFLSWWASYVIQPSLVPTESSG